MARVSRIATNVAKIIAGLHADGLLPRHVTGFRDGADFIPTGVTPSTAAKIAASLCSRAARPTTWSRPS